MNIILPEHIKVTKKKQFLKELGDPLKPGKWLLFANLDGDISCISLGIITRIKLNKDDTWQISYKVFVGELEETANTSGIWYVEIPGIEPEPPVRTSAFDVSHPALHEVITLQIASRVSSYPKWEDDKRKSINTLSMKKAQYNATLIELTISICRILYGKDDYYNWINETAVHVINACFPGKYQLTYNTEE